MLQTTIHELSLGSTLSETDLSFQCKNPCSSWGTEHNKETRYFKKGKCSLGSAEKHICEARRRQIAVSENDQQKAESVYPEWD